MTARTFVADDEGLPPSASSTSARNSVAGLTADPLLSSADSGGHSVATRLMRAAAHLNSGEIRRVIHARDEDRFHARAPEQCFDVEELERELRISGRRDMAHNAILLGIGALTGCIYVGLVDPIPAWSVEAIIAGFIAMGVATAVYERTRRSYARRIWLGMDITSRARGATATEGGAHEDQNLIVSANDNPFVGSGQDIGGWSFTIDLSARAEGATEGPQPLEVADFYDEIAADVQSLRIPELGIRDELFVRGDDIKALFPGIGGRPPAHLGDQRIRAQYGGKDSRVRHYRVFRVPAWGGQLVLSMYLRATQIGDALFVEWRRFLLTPIQERFCAVENMTGRFRLRDVTEALVGGLVTAPFHLVGAAFTFVGAITKAASKLTLTDPEAREVADNPKYNFGATGSLRESWAQGDVRRYFQRLDRDMYLKVLERQVIGSITKCLERRGISTEDLKESRTTILNQGVMVTGGEVSTDNIAVGAGARAIAHRGANAIRSRIPSKS